MKPPFLAPIQRPAAPAVRRPVRGGNGAAGFADHLDAAGNAPPPAEAAESAAVLALAALVAVHAADDDAAAGGRGRARRHGEALLESLDGLQADLLLGRVPVERLAAIARLTRLPPQASGDAGLDAACAAILLRAEVELAKLTGRR
jgi:hypothetical protein